MQRDEVKHYCYLITNIVNNKVYVGVTYKDINKRFSEHLKVAKSKKRNTLHDAIVKYGKENFVIELLEIFDNAKSAYEAEVYYIQKYNSKASGYNETIGGDRGPINLRYSEEVIHNILNEYCDGYSLSGIAKKYNLAYSTIFDITRFRFSNTYNISEETIKRTILYKNNSKHRRRVSKTDIVNIINDYIDGSSMQAIADKYILCINNIWNILHRKSWKSIEIDSELEIRIREKLGTIYKNPPRG